MSARLLAILLLALAGGMPPGLLPPGPAALLSAVAVVGFWWAHAFRLQAINWRVLILFVTSALSTWIYVGGTGVTGISGDYEFQPDQISSLKRSHRIALRLFMDHAPTRDERYLRLGNQAPLPGGVGDQHSRRWARIQLKSLPLDQKLKRIENWFHTSFTYSLDSDWGDLDSFLFDSRRGYCMHFSHATQALLQASGEDAQLVYGYSGGSWNPLTRVLTFRDSDAHSWLEVQDRKSRTWIRVDPTEWVSSVAGEEAAASAREPLVGTVPLRIGALLFAGTLLAGWVLRDPRRQLISLLRTSGPLSTALKTWEQEARNGNRPTLSRCLESVRMDYELGYFSENSRLSSVSRIWGAVRLRLRLFQLRILGWKYLSRLRRGHSRP
jgi:hypothetical protein